MSLSCRAGITWTHKQVPLTALSGTGAVCAPSGSFGTMQRSPASAAARTCLRPSRRKRTGIGSVIGSLRPIVSTTTMPSWCSMWMMRCEQPSLVRRHVKLCRTPSLGWLAPLTGWSEENR